MSIVLFYGGAVCNAEEVLPLPVMMNGDTQVKRGTDTISVGGFGGNQAILNFDLEHQEGFSDSRIRSCVIINPASCFVLDPGASSVRLMTSKTSISGNYVYETAALFSSGNKITGDVSGFDASNFALYGRNLKHDSSDVGSDSRYTWTTEDAINPEAQASYLSDQQEYYLSHINSLKNSAVSVSNINTGNQWYLRNDTSLSGGTSLRTNDYPEGKVWITNTVSLNTNKTYNGIGTIIIGNGGSMTINDGVEIKKLASNPEDHNLGIIIDGNLTLNSNVEIDAAIFVMGDVYFNGDNIKINGSIMAQNFIGADNHYGIEITYDYKLGNKWPPGFRYFNMPTPVDSRN